MQNKGLVKLFALLFGLVSIFQLSFTLKSNQIENEVDQIAISFIPNSEPDFDKKRNDFKNAYLDSISSENVFDIGIANYSYNEVKDRAMNLGLDLKGGINVILQISVKDIYKIYLIIVLTLFLIRPWMMLKNCRKIVKIHIWKIFSFPLI